MFEIEVTVANANVKKLERSVIESKTHESIRFVAFFILTYSFLFYNNLVVCSTMFSLVLLV